MSSFKRKSFSKDFVKAGSDDKKFKSAIGTSDHENNSANEVSKESSGEEYTEPKDPKSDFASREPSDDEQQHGFVKNDAGEYYMQLPGSSQKRVTIRSFKGKTYIDIREFYEKDGKFFPGKKGISLTTEQWDALKRNAEQVDKCIKRL